MTYFERELYRDPDQDLNRLWWSFVKKFQKIESSGSSSVYDWAAKVHIGLAPVYYFSYLLGEMFASAIVESLEKETGSRDLATPAAGQFLQTKLFAPGNRKSWSELIADVTGEPLNSGAWMREFAQVKGRV